MKAGTLAAVLALCIAGSYAALAQQGSARRTLMTFFVTSEPIGDGGTRIARNSRPPSARAIAPGMRT
jgi:hypothetical protein